MKDYPNIELKWRELGVLFQVQFIKTDFISTDDVGLNDDDVGINTENVGLNDDDVGLNDQFLLLIKRDNKISAKELAGILGISSRHCERIIAELKKQGVIERQGSKKSGFWVVKR